MTVSKALLAFLALLATPAARAIDFSPVTDPIGAALASRPQVAGAGLLIVDFDGNVLHEQHWGAFDRATRIPIGSATKWLSAGVVMSLVDDGLLDLDQPVGEILPAFAGQPNGKSEMTVRQMFSHTSGLPGQSQYINSTDLTFEEAVDSIGLLTPMRSAPGAEFRYGGVSMHVAGRVAEVVGGADWNTLFGDRIESPLGVNDVTFDGVGDEVNSRIAGGAQTSLETYARFMSMLAAGGVYEGEQVLSATSVAAMLSDQTGFGAPGGAVLDSKPTSIGEYLGYGVGAWVERRDAAGQPVEFTSPGAFGTTPWIDLENRYWGVFMVDDQLSRFDGLIDDVRAFTAAQLAGVPEPSTLALAAAAAAARFGRRPPVRRGGRGLSPAQPVRSARA